MKKQYLLLLGAFACILLMSCSASISAKLKQNKSCDVNFSLNIPQAIDVKLRQFMTSANSSQTCAQAASVQLFNADAIEKSLKANDIIVKYSEKPSLLDYKLKLYIDDIQKLIANNDDIGKILKYEENKQFSSISVSLSKVSAPVIMKLFDGMDKTLLETLQVPALYDNPVTKIEYKTMLESLLGKTAIKSFDELYCTISLSLPANVLKASDGVIINADKKSIIFKLAVLDALVLEKDINFYVQWQNN